MPSTILSALNGRPSSAHLLLPEKRLELPCEINNNLFEADRELGIFPAGNRELLPDD